MSHFKVGDIVRYQGSVGDYAWNEELVKGTTHEVFYNDTIGYYVMDNIGDRVTIEDREDVYMEDRKDSFIIMERKDSPLREGDAVTFLGTDEIWAMDLVKGDTYLVRYNPYAGFHIVDNVGDRITIYNRSSIVHKEGFFKVLRENPLLQTKFVEVGDILTFLGTNTLTTDPWADDLKEGTEYEVWYNPKVGYYIADEVQEVVVLHDYAEVKHKFFRLLKGGE